MTNTLRDSFGPFGSRVWLDCAHQGPLPRVAVDEVHRALQSKVTPHLISKLSDFVEVSHRLRQALSRLLDADPQNIILGNSASYGMTLLANGLRLTDDDEVLLLDEDFPATRLPFERLQRDGVRIRAMGPRREVLEPGRLRREIGPRTRVLAITWVDSFSGHRCDLEAVGEVCRDRGILFIVNGSQAVGARPIRPESLPIDALVSCGFKWLCGPYGTGFSWVREPVLSRLECLQSNWLVATSDLEREPEGARTASRAESFDVFDTANFLNFMPWTASINLLVDHGLDRVAAHNESLVGCLIEGMDRRHYEIVSPLEPSERSSIVMLSHRDRRHNPRVHRALKEEGIDISLRQGLLRVAPHVYNTTSEIADLLSVMNRYRPGDLA